MKNLLFKEFRLARHETMYFFPLFALMLLIPSYPYYVAFIYTCLEIFFIFQFGIINKDVLYTVTLPVRKRDAVKARCYMIAIIQVFQILFAVPFAILRARINPLPNDVGIEANVAFFGLVFVMYAVFNILFIPLFYKTAYKTGRALLFGGSGMFLYIVLAEIAVRVFPALDTVDAASQLRQIPVLLGGMLVYAVAMMLAYRIAAKRFEAVDL